MTIAEAQSTVDQWIKTYGVRYFSELTNLAILTEEVGHQPKTHLIPDTRYLIPDTRYPIPDTRYPFKS